MEFGVDAVGEQLPLHVLYDDRALSQPPRRFERLSVEQHLAVMPLQPGDDAGEGGLAGAVGAG